MNWVPDWNAYDSMYQKIHPYEVTPEYSYMDGYLKHVCSRIMSSWNDINQLAVGPFKTWSTSPLGLKYDPKNPISALWLFWTENIEIKYDDLVQLLIRVNNFDLSVNDYALLLYVSYQDEETRNLLNSFPMSMLREMYEPIQAAHYAEWEKVTSR
jgi:hypothetical protein